MAYDDALAARVRTLLDGRDGLVEKRMFGGLAFLLHGNLCVGVLGDDVILRLDRDEAERALGEPGIRPFDITGRAMKGWAMAGPEAVASDEDLGYWVDRAVDFASALPPKA